MINKLMDLHLDSIKFSVQGVDEKTYYNMRGGDYKKLLSTLKMFHTIRGEREFTFIQVSTTLTGETDNEIEKFKKMIELCVDYYNIGYTKLNHLNVDAMNISDDEKIKSYKCKKVRVII